MNEVLREFSKERTLPDNVFPGSIEELKAVVLEGGKGHVPSLCNVIPEHGYCHLERAYLPHVLTPFNTIPLNAEKVLLKCGMDCGYACTSARGVI